MKHVLFLTRLFHPHIGGVETHVYQLAQQLQKDGYQITVITEQFETDLAEYERVEKIEVVRIPKEFITSKIKLWRWIKNNTHYFQDAEIVHVHDVFWWIVPVLPIVRNKFFITFHGWEGTFPIKKTAIIQRNIAAKLSRGVIQVGDYVEKWYSTKPDIVTYGATSTRSNKIRPVEVIKKALGHKNIFKTAVFVGRLSEDNDVRKVIELFGLWKSQDSKIKFLFLGDGPLRDECNRIGKVKGFVKNVDEYLVDAQVVFAASYLSIMQAQVLGKLVCAFYSNPLKKDYLKLYPQSKAMIISDSVEEAWVELQAFLKHPRSLNDELKTASGWARQQTWDKVVVEYERIWRSKK
jgi:glycosyltransferase involved in cell wall biosynthesis